MGWTETQKTYEGCDIRDTQTSGPAGFWPRLGDRRTVGSKHISNMAAKLFQLFNFSQLILSLLATEGPNFFPAYIDVNSKKKTSKQREDTSEGYFECVRINELVDIEGRVDIENVHVVNLSVDRCI